tara:strand:- start:36 stop:323 length:288 start_codon:yes stop_codon:yes gene_type:complete
MKGYVVCVYTNIDDENALKYYAAKAREAVEKYKGIFLVRGGKKIALEGDESPRTVVIEFSSFEIAKNFYNSKEYQEAKSILKGKVVRQYQIVEGS